MRVAFLSDIHANFPALCAALERARLLRAERLVVAGDIIGGGPHPVEVIRLLQERSALAIRGNVERKILSLQGKARRQKRWLKRKNAAHLVWTARQLGDAEWEWLATLPDFLHLDFDSVRAQVVHGTPQSDEEYLYPSVTAEAIRRAGIDPVARALVCGHSHIPFTKMAAGIRVINCGSVGRPVDGDPRGAFAVADFVGPAIRCPRIVRFRYAVADLVADLAERAVPGARGGEYLRGIKLRGV
ncbi:MAG TPA: metallophosphoesterase family protein [Acidobacteriota bacterium]|nr:metallophosphoesterase family protein [Acidobacteriota bacterium]HQM63743.1 metallophosphoesterase family protein [Acidobacteriota bacterium]